MPTWSSVFLPPTRWSEQSDPTLSVNFQLEEHIVRLREELDREREEKSYFQLERDKIRAFWEICKRHLEETRAELRNREREGEEAEERHRVEITVSCSNTVQRVENAFGQSHSEMLEIVHKLINASAFD